MTELRIENRTWVGIIILCLSLFSCAEDSGEQESGIEAAYWEDYEAPEAHWGWIDKSNHLVIPVVYDDARDFSEGLAAVNDQGRWGYIDTSGAVRIAPQYMEGRSFHEGRAAVKNFNGAMAFIDRHGHPVTPFSYLRLGRFHNGRAAFLRPEGWGYVDTSGREIVPPMYESAWPYYASGIARVKKDGHYLLINREGVTIGPSAVETIKAFSGGYYRTRQKGSWGLVDTAGRVVVPAEYDEIRPSADGVMLMRKGQQYTVYPGMRPLVVPAQMSGLKYVGAGRIRFYDGDSVGLMDTLGRVVVAPHYSQINRYREGLALCDRGEESWNWLRRDGHLLTRTDFPLAWDFYGGMARMITREGIGVIDTAGTVWIAPSYPELRDFKEGLARVQLPQ